MDGQPRLPAHLSSIHHNPGRNRPAAYSGDSMTHPVLTALGLSAVESGTYLGNNEWSSATDAGVIETFSPTSGELLAKAHADSAADSATLLERPHAPDRQGGLPPATRPGEAIPTCGSAEREPEEARIQ